MPELTQDELTLLRICFYERIKAIQRMRHVNQKWTKEEVDRGVKQVKDLALIFGMEM